MRHNERGSGSCLGNSVASPLSLSPGPWGRPSSPGWWRPRSRGSRSSPRSWGRGAVVGKDGVEDPVAELVRPHVTMDWSVWDWDNAVIGLIPKQRSEGRTCLMATRACVMSSVIINWIKLYNFWVELWVFRTSMNWITGGLWNVRHVSHIDPRKIYCFEYDFGSWTCRGADMSGVWVLYEEITYNRMSPHRLELRKDIFIQYFLFKLRGFFFGVDVIKEWDKSFHFVDKGTFLWDKFDDFILRIWNWLDRIILGDIPAGK